jgi:hypothetical protein
LSERDESFTDDNDGFTAVNDFFLPREQNEQPVDSDISVKSATEKLDNEIPSDYSADSDQIRRGDS